MTDNSVKLKKTITLEIYNKNPDDYQHLFEVQLPPENINLFKVRYNFEMGTPLVGDLVLDLNVDNKRLKNFFLEKVKILKNNCNKNNLINQR